MKEEMFRKITVTNQLLINQEEETITTCTHKNRFCLLIFKKKYIITKIALCINVNLLLFCSITCNVCILKINKITKSGIIWGGY